MESNNEGWKTPEAAWFDTKTKEEGEVFLVKVSFAEKDTDSRTEEVRVVCVRVEDEYKL
jgi:hypothetical protein